MVNRRFLPDVTTAPIEISSIHRRIKTHLSQSQIPRQILKKTQNTLAQPAMHEIRVNEDCANLTVRQIEHAGRHGLALNAAYIEVLVH